MKSSLRIIVTGLIAQHPFTAGITWHHLQYVVGLARLGHDVYYFEHSDEWPYNVDGGPTRQDWIAYDCTYNVEYLAGVMARFGLADRWAYHFPIKPRWFGLPWRKRREVLESADLLINISGTLRRPQDYDKVGRLVYIDTDPVFTQVKLNLPRGQVKFRRRVDAHDIHFTFGECFTDRLPTGHRWQATRQPIVLSEWRPMVPTRDVFTTITNWTSYRPLKYRGKKYGQKDVEFARYLDLPRQVAPHRLEVALSATEHTEWQTADLALPLGEQRPERRRSPRDLLAQAGWQVVDPSRICPDLDGYRRYIESSRAEWSVAKNGYIVGQPGWFSDRSACYLAAGRPVVVQDTGFSRIIPTGEGIVPFKTVEEAVSAIEEVSGNYARHARAARALAEEYFDSAKVLTRLLDDASGSAPETGIAGSDSVARELERAAPAGRS